MTNTTTIKCAFCQGKGKDPFKLLSELAICQVCNGEGKVNVISPYDSCPFCGGSGIQPHTRLVCTVCRGFGVISHQKDGKDCPACAGSGKNIENDLPCSTCGGSGKVE